MPSGGKRPNAGRPKNRKNRATVERELQAQADLAKQAKQAQKRGTLELGKTVIERQMKLAESMMARHQRITEPQATALRAAGNREAIAQTGDEKLFGLWFDRWTRCAFELTKYQSPPVKAVEAPAPPPDPGQLERDSVRRFGLRVFEGGKALPQAPNGAA